MSSLQTPLDPQNPVLIVLEVEEVKQKQEGLVEQVVIEPQDCAVHWVEVQEPGWEGGISGCW